MGSSFDSPLGTRAGEGRSSAGGRQMPPEPVSQETYPKARQCFRVDTEGFVGWSRGLTSTPLPRGEKVSVVMAESSTSALTAAPKERPCGWQWAVGLDVG